MGQKVLLDGVTIHDNATKFTTAYASSMIVDLLSITLLDQCTFFSGASSQREPYKCELGTKTVTQTVCNSTLPCSVANQVCLLNGKVVYWDTKAGKVMQYNPGDKSVRALVAWKWPQQFFQWDTRFMLIQTTRGDMLRRQDLQMFPLERRMYSDEPLRNDIFPREILVPFKIPLEFILKV